MSRKLLIGLVVVVFALMLSNVMIGKVALELYQSYNALRRDPLGILHQQEIQQGEYDYFLIGDSLIARWNIPEYAVANHGISAQTSGQALYRMRLLGDKIHAQKSIIWVGGNDLKILRVDPELSPTIIPSSLSTIREIIKLSKRISEKTYILTIPPIYTVPFYMKPFKSTHVMLSSLEALNHGIIQVAQEEGAEVIHCEQVLHDMQTTDILASDRIHLSEKAYEKIFSEINND